jgi:5-methyltetrahydropteroyltriglutamate--homocysteine methyltransferase
MTPATRRTTTTCIESDDEIVERIHKALEHIDPEHVYLTTDCRLKALPRFCAFEKLKALCRAAARVRDETGARGAVAATAGA